eukprot:382355-Hanusia_phi.AAC.1
MNKKLRQALLLSSSSSSSSPHSSSASLLAGRLSLLNELLALSDSLPVDPQSVSMRLFIYVHWYHFSFSMLTLLIIVRFFHPVCAYPAAM